MACQKHLRAKAFGACWDYAAVERFFGSLKHDWLFKVPQPTREFTKKDAVELIWYYNVKRLHLASADQSQINHKNSFFKVSGWT